MKLYYKPGACSLAPHIVAHEAGIAVTPVLVDLGAKKLPDGGDYLAINGKGYVPALETDGGEVLTEVGAILQYLGDLKPESGLVPKAGTPARYKQQEWLSFIATEVHKNLGSFFNPAQTPEWRKGVEAILDKRLAWLEKNLGAKPYLTGDAFTAADAYLFVVLNWTMFTGFDLDRYPGLVAFRSRVAARPKVIETLKAEGLAK